MPRSRVLVDGDRIWCEYPVVLSGVSKIRMSLTQLTVILCLRSVHANEDSC